VSRVRVRFIVWTLWHRGGMVDVWSKMLENADLYADPNYIAVQLAPFTLEIYFEICERDQTVFSGMKFVYYCT